MKAVVLTGHGGLDKLVYRADVPAPTCSERDVLIRVEACGLNNTDINTRIGWYSENVETSVSDAMHGSSAVSDGTWSGDVLLFPRIQGADPCGVVVDGDSSLHGKRVLVDPWLLDPENPHDANYARYFGSEVDGGYAEYTVAPESNVYVINSNYSSAELATFGCSYTTALNMLEKARLAPGESLVISGASGGVGTALIQLGKLKGAVVTAISRLEKAQELLVLGADFVVDRYASDVVAEVKQSAGEIHVVADTVGGDTFSTLVDCLGHGGRYVSCGAIAGPMVNFDLRKLVYRDLEFFGATVVPSGIFRRLINYIESGELKPVLAETYPLRHLARAQEVFMKKQHVGNIVVIME